MTSICVGCGLCCDGTMYTNVEVVALRVRLSREFEPRDSKSHHPDEVPE